jgi:hypothetical protein
MSGTPSNGTISKNSNEVWSGVVASTGTASFYRFAGLTDDTLATTTEIRLQGTVGVAGADLNFSSVNFTANDTKTINSYSIALPTA